MANPLKLTKGKKYQVVKSFIDYDRITHPIGEEWVFVETNFSPHAEGLTLHVKIGDKPGDEVYRFQWTDDEQAEIIRNFRDFVKEV